MADTKQDTIIRYLQDALAAEEAFEKQLRAFSEEGDDDEVKAAFRQHADETGVQSGRLRARLQELNASPSVVKSVAASLLAPAPSLAQIPSIQEERTVQNVAAAYTIEACECAMYEALAAASRAAADPATERLARSIQKEEHQAAESFWHFLPTRSLIAFNMLTVSEIDPAVETKVGEASWLS